MNTVTAVYLVGIREGRIVLRELGITCARDILAGLEENCCRFSAQSPVGQMMRGERDFWRNQMKGEKQ
jgi:hypothetical protein